MLRSSPLYDGRAHCPRFAAALLATVIVGVFAFSTTPSPTASAQVVDDLDNDGLQDLADPCPADPRNLCYGLLAVDKTTGEGIRLNAGVKRNVPCSGMRIDCNGHVWNSDFGYNLSAKTGVCDLEGAGVTCTIAGVTDIFGCDSQSTQDIFRCEHFDRAIEPELSYAFAVENDEYLVNLLFANTFLHTADVGARLFDVAIEGNVVYAGFDQVAAAGGSGIAVIRSAIVNVDDGVLDVRFAHAKENPAIKGIEVLRRVPCVTDADCADADLCNGNEVCSGLYCTGGAPVLCETDEVCDPPTATCLERGGPCQDDTDCIGDEICNADTSLCQPLGGPCDDDTDCAGDEVCNLDSGTCQELGGPCEDGTDCAGDEICNPTSQKCQPRGEPCDGGEDCGADEACIEGTCGPSQCTPACDSICERCDAHTCSSLCANPFEPSVSNTTAADALAALRTATGLQTCALCLCDALGDGEVTASDALAILRHALALPVSLNCSGPLTSTTLP